MNYRYSFDELETADFKIDAVYEASTEYKNVKGEPFHKLFPHCSNQSGFRKINRKDMRFPAYVILYTTMDELEWPDYLDVETGVFRYYGDNRKPGNDLENTFRGGNKLLRQVFEMMSTHHYEDIPPFFVFRREGSGRDVRFLGLAAPGNPNISPDQDLVAFWRTIGESRFQNYEAYFTILDSQHDYISREWLNALIDDHDNSLKYAPECWRRFINNGRSGIIALKSPRLLTIPSRYEQLQSDELGNACMDRIRSFYKDKPYEFELCATDIISKLDHNFVDFSITRPWRDGGRDAFGYYKIQPGGKTNYPLKIDCALEAKCYQVSHGVGVKEMSRLISRIRYRQFGIMVTTSYVDTQAYREVKEDGHPILIVSACDIACILRKNAIDLYNIDEWLHDLPSIHRRCSY